MNDFVSEINKRLAEAESSQKKRDALKGFYIFVIFLSALILLLSLVENIFFFSSTIRAILFFGSLISIVFFVIKLIATPLLQSAFFFSKPDYLKTAAEVGNKFSEIKDDLKNALQLVSETETNYSTELINAAFERIYNKSKQHDFKLIVDYSGIKKYLGNALLAAGIVLFFLIFIPGISSALSRIIHYNTNFTPPPKFIFEITPGDAEITKGSSIKIVVKTSGKTPGEIILSTKSDEQTEYVERKLIADSLGNFSYEASLVKSSFVYYAYAEGIESNSYKISVVNRPVITNFELIIIPPAYSKLPEITQRDNGNITALPGSKVKLNLVSTRKLASASIEFTDSTSKQMSVNDESASIEFNVAKEMNYQMLINDKDGIANINPIVYSIKLLTDESPTIEVVSPNQNIKLGNDAKISLISKIKDDYGFTKMNLNFRLSASKYRPLSEVYTASPISINKELKEDEIYYVWDLSPLVLAEGEVLSYYLEIFDNDIVNGPKSAKSQIFTIQVPSMDELFAGADNTQQKASEDLTETMKEAERLQQEMQKISDDLKQNNREISWQEKERVEKAADKFKELTNKIDEVSQKLADMKKDLMQNNLLSEETLQKYNELQKLLDEMSSDEMKEAMKKMQEALKNLSRDNVQMSLEDMKANEENFKKSLERTVNLLKRIQIEQKIDELVKRTEEMADKLNELKEKTEKSNLSDKQKQNELSQRQQDATDEMKRLNEEMNKLNDKMSDMKDMPKDKLQKAIDDFEKQENQKLSDEALQDLKEMQKMEAMKNQQQMSQNMQSMNKLFQDLQSAMQQMNQVKTFYDMMKILNDLLTLSKSQEDLKNKSDQMSSNRTELNKNAREQSELQNSLNKVLQNMSSLSQKTFAITPEMGKALGQAYSDMQQSINSMQNQNGSFASQLQKQAMQHLNEAASLMKGGMDQMMNGSGQGGGMMSLMQQMQQMSQQQMTLNQMTQMMNQGKITPEMAGQMQRLAQQQEMIRKSLEQMNKEARESGQSKRLAANLEKVLQDMKEVVTNLQSKIINDDLVKQQERILSRLLDAQRSVNERDYEKDRKSNSGQNTVRNSPPDLILSTEEGKNKLKDELLKAIREGYKKDYEDLIRKYFEALGNEKK